MKSSCKPRRLGRWITTAGLMLVLLVIFYGATDWRGAQLQAATIERTAAEAVIPSVEQEQPAQAQSEPAQGEQMQSEQPQAEQEQAQQEENEKEDKEKEGKKKKKKDDQKSKDDDDDDDDNDDDIDDDDDDDDCEDEHAADEGCVYVSRQIVVKLNPAAGVSIDMINATYGTTLLEPLLGSAGIYLLETPSLDSVGPLLVNMRQDQRLLYAEPNFYGEVPEGGGRGKWAWGGSAPVPAGLNAANPQFNWAEIHQLSRGTGTVVAVLDTGFQLDHPQLAGRWSDIRYDFVDDDPIPAEMLMPQALTNEPLNEMAGHGTHVAGIISMVAPEVKIMPLRVLDDEGRGSVFVIAEAVLYAVEYGADVINLSLGTTQSSELLEDIIEDAVEDANVVVVAAAGNLNSTLPQFPAADDDVLAVAALDGNGLRADFSNYGIWIDVAAPGVGILSAYPVNSYAYWSGTSMATPFVAGQAALLRSINPTITAEAIEIYIVKSARPLGDGLGGGMIDFAQSLRMVGAVPDLVAVQE